MTALAYRLPDMELLAALSESVGPVRAVQRTASPQASTATLEAVQVELLDGTSLDLLLKSGGRDSPHEVTVYRDVLDSAELGTPGFVAGSVHGPGWLLVEALPGGPLWQSAAVESWCEAARWLARAHRQLAGNAAALRPVTGSRFEEQLERAVQRHPRGLDLRGACSRAAALLRAVPPTVVHGEAFPSNVLVGPAGELCLVDWETAGSGPGLLDLAALCVGWPPDDAARIAAAYVESLSAESLPDESLAADALPADALALLPAARLVVAMRWLSEPLPAAGAGGGHARRTDWWGEAVSAAALLP